MRATRAAWHAILAAAFLSMGCAKPAWSACLSSLQAVPPDLVTRAHAGQVWVPTGWTQLGSRKGYPDEQSATGLTRVRGFWMDRTEVTNAQFAAFVKDSGYVTEAERQGGGAVFEAPTPASHLSRGLAWWRFVPGANWRHPGGPGSDLRGREAFPVVLVTLADALAYARWLGRDLPTEAEWEHAAKAGRLDPGLDAAPRDARGRPTANYWQGSFPLLDLAEDGHAGLAPAGCYPANRWGLHDMIGNAWELTLDAYTGARQPHANGDPAVLRARTEGQGRRVVIKGGSFLCAPDYCVRYRASAREAHEADLATSHVGFRTITRSGPRPPLSSPRPTQP
ncbi:SUMF1/EgtB/PvdO family nonheme iron enzyme [uncultured Aquabacterium sp.]|uniref:SUMF1/EgtB/PvdO family nonheme iron enzyme n=1 Tax=Aquabacterium sp. TaxID=1872578 RepID=UPI0025FF057C|nr:SUMF1/EgtB/PvdO family nonheme iron enzyme [uncultured Aquabacterium sp.]